MFMNFILATPYYGTFYQGFDRIIMDFIVSNGLKIQVVNW
jgi:hypothetical protein